MPLAHILRHFKTAKALSDRPNVTLFHYADMTRDLAGTFAKVANLLNVSYSNSVMERLVQAATFDNMQTNAERFAPSGGKGFFKTDKGFFTAEQAGSGTVRSRTLKSPLMTQSCVKRLVAKTANCLKTGRQAHFRTDCQRSL